MRCGSPFVPKVWTLPPLTKLIASHCVLTFGIMGTWTIGSGPHISGITLRSSVHPGVIFFAAACAFVFDTGEFRGLVRPICDAAVRLSKHLTGPDGRERENGICRLDLVTRVLVPPISLDGRVAPRRMIDSQPLHSFACFGPEEQN